MIKHTQTNCRQQATNCLSVFDHFGGFRLEWTLKRVKGNSVWLKYGHMDSGHAPPLLEHPFVSSVHQKKLTFYGTF